VEGGGIVMMSVEGGRERGVMEKGDAHTTTHDPHSTTHNTTPPAHNSQVTSRKRRRREERKPKKKMSWTLHHTLPPHPRPYYHHPIHGTTWQKPKELQTHAERNNHYKKAEKNGKTYWWHTETRETTWTEPTEAREEREEKEREEEEKERKGKIMIKEEEEKQQQAKKERNERNENGNERNGGIMKEEEKEAEEFLKSATAGGNSNHNAAGSNAMPPPLNPLASNLPIGLPSQLAHPGLGSTPGGPLSGNSGPILDPVFLTAADAEDAFDNLLRQFNVDQSWSWQRVMTELIDQPMYRAIKKLEDRKIAFEAYIKGGTRQERVSLLQMPHMKNYAGHSYLFSRVY